MGLRAFLMINIVDNIEHPDLFKALRALEKTAGVDFVDRVIGSRDIVVMIDTADTIEAFACRIRSQPWVKDLEALRIINLYESHRGCKSKQPKSFPHAGN